MTRPILILRNIPRENPGLIEILLKEHSIKYQIVDFTGSTVIESLKNHSALIVLGGPDSANDLTPKMQNELSLIREAVQSHLPYLGICLGFQTLVRAMGGTVAKCQANETGFRDPDNNFFRVKLTDEGRTDPLFHNLSDNFTVFQLHGETVGLNSEMKLLATGNLCQNQVVKIGDTAYGIQSHFELTNDLLESWIVEDKDLRKLDADQLRSDFETIKPYYQNTARQLFSNFLAVAGLKNSMNA
jgi:GMP synthase (glutamine-hydrolysing)